MRFLRGAPVVAALLAAVGCDVSSTILVPTLEADAAVVAMLEDDALLADLLSVTFTALAAAPEGFGGPGATAPASAATETTLPIERSATCAEGGQIVLRGTAVRIRDEAHATTTLDVSGEKRFEECARSRGATTLRLVGGGTFEAFRKQVSGAWMGPQTLTQSGRFRAESSDGLARECDYALRRVDDPELGTTTIEGAVCGTPVARTSEGVARPS